ncbi:putative spermidine/putrescine transport system substrate-binding protein [Actinopolymorpha cephalotaxi]|uniref:Putative spermidine/putrescine transport system substrate-binding protein n=1 Tax=Actinopolymorpha cephalotaxi TaxID=504797 RepID=A0A1I2KY63_9ACTN|nr:putative spermidine/putrescine transport system substrate-binding protein [Actinopolymorpha cephalotaxi]
MRSRSWHRRSWHWRSWHKAVLSSVVVLALGLAGTACGGNGGTDSSSGGGGGKTARLYVGGDVNLRDMWQKSLIPAFRKDNPGYDVKLTFSEHGVNDTTTLAKLGAAVKGKQDPGFDLAESGFIGTAALSGLLTKVSTKQVPNLTNVDAGLLTPVKQSAVPYRGSSVVLAYNAEHVPDPPKTLDDLLAWIKAHPGKFTYNSPPTGGSGQSFVTTVLDKYVPAGDRQKMVTDYVPDLEKDWDRGFAELKGLNGSIYQHVYPNGNQDVLNLLAKGQIWVAPVWSDMALSGKQTGLLGKEIKLAQISEPSFTGGAVYLGVAASAPNKDAAYKLLDWLLEPAQQKKVVDVLAGYPAVSLDKLPADVRSKFAGLDTQHLRQTYSQKMTNDLNNLWQQKVPG